MDQMLKSLKEKSAIINEQTEQFQTEIKSIMNEMIQSNLNNELISKYNSKLDTLFADYSSSINRLEIEYLIKSEQYLKNPTRNLDTSPNKAKTHSHAYKCDKCDISYTAKTSLKRHKRKNHSTNSSNKLSTDSDESTLSSDESLYKCIHCDERYSSLYRLGQHIREDHSTANNNNSDEFVTSHSGDSKTTNTNKFKCNICNKTFKSAAGLGGHMTAHRRHSMVSDTDTDTNSNTETDDSDNVSEDDSDDDDDIAEDRPYKCKFCNKAFKNTPGLRQHVMQVHKKNPWECNINECQERFKLKRDLKAHKESVHSGNNDNDDNDANETSSYNDNNDKLAELVDDNDNNDNEARLYCVCRQPYDGRAMIGCVHCIEWYHYQCVGLTEEQNVPEYTCFACHRKSQRSSSSSSSEKI